MSGRQRERILFSLQPLSLRENAGLLLYGARSTWRSRGGGAERLLDGLGIPRKVSQLLIIEEHQIPSTKYQIARTKYKIQYDEQSVVFDIWYLVFGILVFGIWCMVCGVQFP